jgi:drug/metabolite transporter (DMT)-like permease
MANPHLLRIILLTLLALTAFAANSVLCRLALADATIDAASFSSIRLVSGAVVLSTILALRHNRNARPSTGNWTGALMLFLYAVPFSYAYRTLDTGTGALILFGAVQITMIAASVISGTRLHAIEWIGVLVAFTGLVYMNLPGVSAPSLFGFTLMAMAGVAWGMYTLNGRDSKDALMDTAHNFIRTVPLVAVLMLAAYQHVQFSMQGIMLAILSGGIASGIGYSIWYTVLRDLTTAQAAVVQLSVPMIAALGGVVFVSEFISLRLGISSALILGGILLVIIGRQYMVRMHASAHLDK